MNNHKIINKQSKHDLKDKYATNPSGWKIYTNRIQRHPFIQHILMDRYQGVCQFCGKPIVDNLNIHHANYDNVCLYPDRCIRLPSPTEKRPNRTRIVPNCEGCQNLDKCTKDLYPVHGICNMVISKIFEKERKIDD